MATANVTSTSIATEFLVRRTARTIPVALPINIGSDVAYALMRWDAVAAFLLVAHASRLVAIFRTNILIRFGSGLCGTYALSESHVHTTTADASTTAVVAPACTTCKLGPFGRATRTNGYKESAHQFSTPDRVVCHRCWEQSKLLSGEVPRCMLASRTLCSQQDIAVVPAVAVV